MKMITVPKNEYAKDLLDQDRCPPDQLDEICLSQEEFDNLWNSNIFVRINEICNVKIDDYEDEEIGDYENILVVLDFLQSSQWPVNILQTVRKIEHLFGKAIEYKTSVHFYF